MSENKTSYVGIKLFTNIVVGSKTIIKMDSKLKFMEYLISKSHLSIRDVVEMWVPLALPAWWRRWREHCRRPLGYDTCPRGDAWQVRLAIIWKRNFYLTDSIQCNKTFNLQILRYVRVLYNIQSSFQLVEIIKRVIVP